MANERTGVRRRSVLAGAAAGAAAAFAGRRAGAADEIVVGATVPITGILASSGLQYYDALQLAVADINAAGGINGKTFRIAFEDTGASTSVAVNAFIKLAEQLAPPFIFLSSYTVQNLAVEPQVARAAIPTVYAGGAIAIAARHDPWMFRIRPQDTLAGEAIGAFTAKRLGLTDIGIIHVLDDYGTATAKSTEAALIKAGAKVVATAGYNARDSDYAPQLLSLKNAGAKALIAFSYIRDGALVLRQRNTLGLTMPFIGNTSFVVPSLLDLVGPDDLKDVWVELDAMLGDTIGPQSVSYMQRFQQKFGMGADPFGSCFYDAAMILADALRKVGPDRVAIRDYFAHVTDYPGVTRRFTTDALGNMAHSVVMAAFVPGGKTFKLIETHQQGAT